MNQDDTARCRRGAPRFHPRRWSAGCRDGGLQLAAAATSGARGCGHGWRRPSRCPGRQPVPCVRSLPPPTRPCAAAASHRATGRKVLLATVDARLLQPTAPAPTVSVHPTCLSEGAVTSNPPPPTCRGTPCTARPARTARRLLLPATGRRPSPSPRRAVPPPALAAAGSQEGSYASATARRRRPALAEGWPTRAWRWRWRRR